jgi:tetratricopeptide (TPR) repeat protein
MVNLDKISKYIFCVFVFLLPFFFIQQTGVPQVLNEKALLLVFAFIVFFIELLDVFISQKVIFRDSPIQRLMLYLSFSFFISFLFSKNIFLSFWGRPIQADSFVVFLACLVVFYCSSWLQRRDVLKVLEFFVTGSAILSILYLVQRFAKLNLSLFDNIGASSIVISIALTFLISFVFNNLNYFRKGKGYSWVKVSSMGVFFILFFVSLFLIDFKLSWFFVAIGTFFIFWRSALESGFKLKRQKAVFSLSLLLIFLSLFFLPNPWGSHYSESSLSYESSWNIAGSSLTESVKNFLIGSGPSTYQYQFSLYKDKAINLAGSSLIFNEGAIPLLTFFVTIGAVGMLFFLLLIIFFYYQGFRYFLDFKREKSDKTVNVRDILFPVVFCLSLLMFFYKIDVPFLFLLFFVLGLWDGQQKGEERVFEISGLPKNMVRAVFSLFFVFLGIVIFNFINYYRAEISYQKSIRNFENNGAVIESIQNMEKSSKLWKSSEYQIGLAQLYLIKASDDFKQRWTTDEKKEEQRNSVKENAAKAESAAKVACSIDKNSFQSWQNLGLVYENTNYLVEDRTKDALDAYNKARGLAPQNYDIYVAIGRMLEKQGRNDEALESYQKAFELYPLDEQLTKKIKALQ